MAITRILDISAGPSVPLEFLSRVAIVAEIRPSRPAAHKLNVVNVKEASATEHGGAMVNPARMDIENSLLEIKLPAPRSMKFTGDV